MPPRHAYWTIIFGSQPTSFRSATQDELLPTVKQIQSKHPDAVMMWFARGKLWKSPEEEREAMFRRRSTRPDRRREDRGAGGEEQGARSKGRGAGSEDRGSRFDERGARSERRPPQGRPLHDRWKPAPPRQESQQDRPGRDRPWQDRPPRDREQRPRQDRPGQDRPWQNRPPRDRQDRHRPPQERPRQDRPAGERWKPAPPRSDRGPEGGGQPRGNKGKAWRPGGEHKDPRDKFKVPRDVKRKRMAARFGWKKKKDEDK